MCAQVPTEAWRVLAIELGSSVDHYMNQAQSHFSSPMKALSKQTSKNK